MGRNEVRSFEGNILCCLGHVLRSVGGLFRCSLSVIFAFMSGFVITILLPIIKKIIHTDPYSFMKIAFFILLFVIASGGICIFLFSIVSVILHYVRLIIALVLMGLDPIGYIFLGLPVAIIRGGDALYARGEAMIESGGNTKGLFTIIGKIRLAVRHFIEKYRFPIRIFTVIACLAITCLPRVINDKSIILDYHLYETRLDWIAAFTMAWALAYALYTVIQGVFFPHNSKSFKDSDDSISAVFTKIFTWNDDDDYDDDDDDDL